ncbi:MAG: MATE family efflux transporter [Bacilli bacterium]|nr:MATE family efflux transporter [Bacilli bacterium]
MATYKLDEHYTYKKLFRFVLPSILMMLFTSIYTMVDGIFISGVSKEAFAGVNFIYPVISLLGAVGFMIGAGGSALIGKKLGENDKEKANQYFSLFVYVSAGFGIGLSILVYFFMPNIVEALQADSSIAPYCNEYGKIMICFIPLFILQMEFQSYFIVAEKTNLSTIITIACGLFNIILDAIFVPGLGMGVKGAAVATGICQTIGAVSSILYFSFKNQSLLRLGKTSFDGKALLKCITNGSSEFITNVSLSVVTIIYNYQLTKYIGTNGVAAYGVIMYVCLIFLAIFFGYEMGVAPLISFNYGAKNNEELQNLTVKSIKIIAIACVSMCALSYALSYPLSLAFGQGDTEYINLIFRAFLFFSLVYLFIGIPVFTSAFFTALNNGFISFIMSLFRTLFFPLLFAFLLPYLMGSDGIWIALFISDTCSLILAIHLLVVKNKKYNYWPKKLRCGQ